MSEAREYARISAGTFQLKCTSFVPGVTIVSQVLSYFIFLHFIYFATCHMVACYSIPGFNPKEITHSFKFMRT